LGGSVTQEGILQAIEERCAIGEAFHRRDFVTIGLCRWDEARADRVTIEQDGAGATVSGVAANLGASEAEVFA